MCFLFDRGAVTVFILPAEEGFSLELSNANIVLSFSHDA